ncbi:MAG: FecR domain-containing protein [Pseudomonadota bacterium]
MRFSKSLVAIGCLVALAQSVHAADRAGQARLVQADTEQELGGSIGVLTTGDPVWQQARVVTARYGSAEVDMDDGSKLTIGPNSEIVIDEFVFDPDAADGRAGLRLATGMLRVLSGRLPSERLRIQTPVALVGIRGTLFTLEATTPELLKLWVEDGAVTVETRGTGENYVFEAPAYAECTASVCVAGPPAIQPRAFPPAPPTRGPFGPTDGASEGSDGGSNSD